VIVGGQIYCDCCGGDGSMHELTAITMSRSEPVRITCTFCQGLIDAGMLREEWHNGVRRFRRWEFEWTKKELRPVPKPMVRA